MMNWKRMKWNKNNSPPHPLKEEISWHARNVRLNKLVNRNWNSLQPSTSENYLAWKNSEKLWEFHSKHLKLVWTSQRRPDRRRRLTKLSLVGGINSQAPLICNEKLHVRLKFRAAASQHLHVHCGSLQCSAATLCIWTFSEFWTSPATLLNSLSDILNLDTVGEKAGSVGGGEGFVCGENKEASQNFSETALPPNRHNASLWRLNVADCVCWRIWKEEGGEAGRMWCLKSTWWL